MIDDAFREPVRGLVFSVSLSSGSDADDSDAGPASVLNNARITTPPSRSP
jgi:hypothetical protein